MDKQLLGIIKKHEGLRLFPYVCSAGKLTIGYGRNIQEIGITEPEALIMLENDLKNSMEELAHFDWFMRLGTVRKGAIIELHFNIGLPKLLRFKRMIQAISNQDFEQAADEMLDSLWAVQVGKNRSQDMANRLRTNAYT